jgi:hypothetical protein
MRCDPLVPTDVGGTQWRPTAVEVRPSAAPVTTALPAPACAQRQQTRAYLACLRRRYSLQVQGSNKETVALTCICFAPLGRGLLAYLLPTKLG